MLIRRTLLNITLKRTIRNHIGTYSNIQNVISNSSDSITSVTTKVLLLQRFISIKYLNNVRNISGTILLVWKNPNSAQ